jgi:hypothetical protein
VKVKRYFLQVVHNGILNPVRGLISDLSYTNSIPQDFTGTLPLYANFKDRMGDDLINEPPAGRLLSYGRTTLFDMIKTVQTKVVDGIYLFRPFNLK